MVRSLYETFGHGAFGGVRRPSVLKRRTPHRVLGGRQGRPAKGLVVGRREDRRQTGLERHASTGGGGLGELSDGKRKVALTAAGTYALDSLLKQGSASAKNKNGVLDKLGKLVDPKATTGSATVAAVRGAAVEPAKDSVSWMSDSVDIGALMDEGRKLVRDGDFAAAAVKFDEAVNEAEGDEKESASYAEAWALAADDSSARAVKLLRGMSASGIWAGPRALLLARLDIDSGAKAEAKAVLDAASAAKLFVGDDVDLAKSLLAEANAK